MPAPHVASGRITIPYTISGQLHKARAYVRNIQVGGTSFRINSRTTDANDTNWEDAADSLAAALSYLLPAGTTPGPAVLEKLTGIVWIAQGFHTVALGGLSGSEYPASEVTMVLRDIQFYKVKVILLDTNQVAPQHTIDPVGGDTHMDAFVQCWLSTHVGANDPYVWQVGVSNQYLNPTPFVGVTVTLNRKARRRHGLT